MTCARARMSHYHRYYEEQAGGGIPSWYRGSSYQRGSGIGSFLSGLARMAIPLLKTVGKSVAREALSGGLRVMNDVDNDTPFRAALKTRSAESVKNLGKQATNFLLGRGYKARRRRRKNRQLLLAKKSVNVKRRRTKKKKKNNNNTENARRKTVAQTGTGKRRRARRTRSKKTRARKSSSRAVTKRRYSHRKTSTKSARRRRARVGRSKYDLLGASRDIFG